MPLFRVILGNLLPSIFLLDKKREKSKISFFYFLFVKKIGQNLICLGISTTALFCSSPILVLPSTTIILCQLFSFKSNSKFTGELGEIFSFNIEEKVIFRFFSEFISVWIHCQGNPIHLTFQKWWKPIVKFLSSHFTLFHVDVLVALLSHLSMLLF